MHPPPDRHVPRRPREALPPADILLVEDDPAELYLLSKAFRAGPPVIHLHSVSSVDEASAFLRHEGRYGQAPRPQLIVTAIHLPRKLGFELIAEVKGNPTLRPIPVIVFSLYEDPAVIQKSYLLGANCYISKPYGLDAFFGVVQGMKEYWLQIASLAPPQSSSQEPAPVKAEVRKVFSIPVLGVASGKIGAIPAQTAPP